ncbi:MAG: dynamin family protein [Clostridiaceae bacterium]|jgi:hypothetical protein|nr:dynamin family protein [Clostridiaceae bacterium]
MKVIKVNGCRKDIAVIKRNLENVPCNSIFILDNGEPLYEFIENLELDDNLLYNLRIAKEIDFSSVSVQVRDKITDSSILDNITSLSKLLEAMDEDKIKDNRIIIDTEDNDLISKVMQAFIYLDIDIEVMMEKEKRDRKIVNAFIRNYEKLRNSIVNSERNVQNLRTKNDFIDERKGILNILYEIEKSLDKARERELNISVMATKKAGKSVIVNSFLNEQYAPTSFELPTPNNCIYKRSKDNNIRLLYGKNDMLFKSPQHIYKYIYKEFKKAQNDKANGYTIDDMEIYYSSQGSDIAPFTIIDTPGSNYVVAKNNNSENMHKRIAYSWIEKSDVILFLINYSSYLTMDEEEFFKNIKTQFEKHNKFYSLIVVVNKLDEMYISECENKSTARFLDYIRCKLSDLGYKGFIVMGTSARSYFDLIKIGRIDSDILKDTGETESIESLKGYPLRQRLKNLKKKFIGKTDMSSLSFVDDQLEKLECFYGLEDYDLNTLRQKSGIPKLKKYASYIAVQKANVELYGLLIREIDEKYTKLSSCFAINNLVSAKNKKSDELQEIEYMINNIIDKFNFINQDNENKLSFKEFENKLLNSAQISLNKALSRMLDLYETRVDEFFMKLMLKNSSELKMIKNKIKDIDFDINNKAFNEEFKNVVENSLKLLNNEADKKIKHIKEVEDSMKETVHAFSDIIRKEYNLTNFDIAVPQVGKDINQMMLFNMPEVDIHNDVVKEKVLESIEMETNAAEKLVNFFTKVKVGAYSINSRQLRTIKSDYIKYIRSIQYDAYYNSLKKIVSNSIDEYNIQIQGIFSRITSVYQNIFNDMIKELSSARTNSQDQIEALDNKLKFYDEIYTEIKNFIEEWTAIRNASM